MGRTPEEIANHYWRPGSEIHEAGLAALREAHALGRSEGYAEGVEAAAREITPPAKWDSDHLRAGDFLPSLGESGFELLARAARRIRALLPSPATGADTRRCADCGIEAEIHAAHRPGHPFRAPTPKEAPALEPALTGPDQLTREERAARRRQINPSPRAPTPKEDAPDARAIRDAVARGDLTVGEAAGMLQDAEPAPPTVTCACGAMTLDGPGRIVQPLSVTLHAVAGCAPSPVGSACAFCYGTGKMRVREHIMTCGPCGGSGRSTTGEGR